MLRRSSSMDGVMRQHHERHCKVLTGLNLETFDLSCYDRIHQNQADSRSLLTKLKPDINKKIADLRNGRITAKGKTIELPKSENTPFVYINVYNNYKQNFQAIHKLKSLHSAFNQPDETYLNDLRMDLEKHMKLASLLNHQKNALSCYMIHVKDCCDRFSALPNAKPLIEALLIKVLSVCLLIPPETEIEPHDGEDVTQYENLAIILKCCYEINFTNSLIVAQLLKMILSMHLANSDNAGRIRHQIYGDGFLNYMLQHISNANIDINILLHQYSNTVWNFYNQFSILDAVVKGDKDRMFSLLNFGVQIFGQHEQRTSQRNYPYLSQALTRHQLMVLEIMERIYQNSLGEIEDLKISQAQRDLFEFILQKESITHVSSEHFYRIFKEEYHYLLGQVLDEQICKDKLRKRKRLVAMYINNFNDIPEADYEYIFFSISDECNIPL